MQTAIRCILLIQKKRQTAKWRSVFLAGVYNLDIPFTLLCLLAGRLLVVQSLMWRTS